MWALLTMLLRHASDTAVFMHCLPVHHGEEVTANVVDGPQSVIFDQAENRLHVQKVLILTLLGCETSDDGRWTIDIRYQA